MRVLIDEPGEAAWNMAVDTALLELAEQPTLRIYSWQPHAVSLGYFQSIADFEDLSEHTPVVRRTTGGGAIHHGDELTFSLALSSSHLPGSIANSYVLLHDAIVRALTTIGVTSSRANSDKIATARPKSRWCFQDPVRDDLITKSGKLLGSAQRRTNAASPRILHHGSLVINRPSHTPFVAALADQIAVTDTVRKRLQSELITEFAQALQLQFYFGKLTSKEHDAANRICVEQFQCPDFLRRR